MISHKRAAVGAAMLAAVSCGSFPAEAGYIYGIGNVPCSVWLSNATLLPSASGVWVRLPRTPQKEKAWQRESDWISGYFTAFDDLKSPSGNIWTDGRPGETGDWWSDSVTSYCLRNPHATLASSVRAAQAVSDLGSAGSSQLSTAASLSAVARSQSRKPRRSCCRRPRDADNRLKKTVPPVGFAHAKGGIYRVWCGLSHGHVLSLSCCRQLDYTTI